VTGPQPYSITRQLSRRLLVLTLAVLGLLCATIYLAAVGLHERAQQRVLALKVNKLTETAQTLLREDDHRFVELLRANAQRRPGTRLVLTLPDGAVFYADPAADPHLLSAHTRSVDFTLPYPGGARVLAGRFTIDTAHDAQMLRSLAAVLVLATLAAAVAASALATWTVQRGLRPLHWVTEQTQRVSTSRLAQRLELPQPVEELQTWVAQFNLLLARMQATYAQLESFNADVAHELRTPLTALVGKTEVALSRERSSAELRATLESNLEDLHRIAKLVNDMLFVSLADRGARARLGAPVDLQCACRQVVDLHEAEANERGVAVEVRGQAVACVDEGLLQRAVSNLLGNAIRYATPGSTVVVHLTEAEATPRVYVENQGPPIPVEHLPRVFDRFHRADRSRENSDIHHGLGLAIVAAIARMHGGQVFASSSPATTRIGFTLAPAAPVATVSPAP
jgi:two-component system, OmpR family, heavy metal sensor histidine kinase CusS